MSFSSFVSPLAALIGGGGKASKLFLRRIQIFSSGFLQSQCNSNMAIDTNHLLQVEKAIYSASTESAVKSEWLCVTEVLLYPLNSETETGTLVNIKNRLPGTSSLTITTFKLVVFCADPPLTSHRSGTLQHEKQ